MAATYVVQEAIPYAGKADIANRILQLLRDLPQKDLLELAGPNPDVEHALPAGRTLPERITRTIMVKYVPSCKAEKYGIPVGCRTFADRIEVNKRGYYTRALRRGEFIFPGVDVLGYKRDQLGAIYHYSYLLEEWDFMMTPDRRIQYGTQEDFRNLTTSNVHILKLLCKLFIPPGIFIKLSKTYPACLYALMVGRIITAEFDPTADTTYWNKILALSVENTETIAWGYIDAIILYGLEANNQVKDFTTFYSIIHTPEISGLIDLAIRVREEVANNKAYATDQHVMTVVVGLLEQLGLNYKLHDSFEYPVASLLKLTYQSVVPYYLHKVSGYQRQPLPLIFQEEDDLVADANFRLLNSYSEDELQQRYMPHFYELKEFTTYEDKVALTERIREYQTVDRFKFFPDRGNKLACENGANLDVTYGGPRREGIAAATDYDRDTVNPIIHYGSKIEGGHLICYRISELEGAFAETENGFEFRNPDWLPNEVVIDPLTELPVQRTFTLGQIVKLKKLTSNGAAARHSPARDAYRRLDKIVSDGIRRLAQDHEILNNLQIKIAGRPEWRNDLLIYFSWLFLFAMWIRFWKGPGTPYPAVWEEKHENTCEYRQRDQHINIELSVHGNILLQLEKTNNELADFVKWLPYIHYNWRTGEVTQPIPEVADELTGTHTVEGLVDKVQFGNFCMAQATDLLSGSAFSYLTRVMDVPVDRINDLLVYVMQLLYPYEVSAIQGREMILMNTMKPGEEYDEALRTVQDHKSIYWIKQGTITQPGLDIDAITFTRHLPEQFGEIVGML